MRILYYSPHPQLNLSDKTGYGTHMREMIGAFEHAGHEVLPVIMGGLERNESGQANIQNPSVLKRILKVVVPKYVWRTLKDRRLLQFDIKAESELQKKVESFKPHLIYERAYYLQVSGVNVANRNKITHFLEVNAPYIDETFEFEKSSSYYSKLALKNEELQLSLSDKVFVVSSALKDYFIKKYKNLPPDKIIITPNCVNLEKVKINRQTKITVSEKYSLQNHTVIGFVGSIFPYHGVDVLIEAFNEVYKKNKNVKLMIVGDGLILEELKTLSKNLEASGNIIFTGNVPYSEVFSYIDLMDVTVLATTEWYCSPIKLFEYGALGKAIVAPDTPSVRDVIEDGKDGLLIKNSRGFLVKALTKLIENKEARLEMGSSFKKKIENKYTWIKNAEFVLKHK
jgi:glycosyltransferase involved in cell wall biosynthesis